MPRIDFYILKKSQEEGFRYLARLVEKAYHLNKGVYIYASNLQQAQLIDELLWSFKPESFLPHELVESANKNTPILIGHASTSQAQAHCGSEICCNLSTTVPTFYSQFDRLIELVWDEKSCQENGRHKYREYQKLGCQVSVFNIT